MKARRIYRTYTNPSFPLYVMAYHPRRIMESFVHIHWHPEPELLYAKEGEYEIYDDKGNFLLHPGEVCVVPTDKVHAIRCLSPRGEYWSISFSIDLISMSDIHFFQQELVAPLKAGTLVTPNKITPTPKGTHALEDIIHGSRDQQFIGLMTFLLELLPLCKRNTQRRDVKRTHGAVQACIQYMDVNYASRITLDELAEHVHLHPNYLCAIFKSRSGQTIFEYLTSLRIAKARNLLSKGNLPVTQVAEKVGFNDTDHFSRAFKSHVGISPSAYRKAYNEN